MTINGSYVAIHLLDTVHVHHGEDCAVYHQNPVVIGWKGISSQGDLTPRPYSVRPLRTMTCMLELNMNLNCRAFCRHGDLVCHQCPVMCVATLSCQLSVQLIQDIAIVTYVTARQFRFRCLQPTGEKEDRFHRVGGTRGG